MNIIEANRGEGSGRLFLVQVDDPDTEPAKIIEAVRERLEPMRPEVAWVGITASQFADDIWEVAAVEHEQPSPSPGFWLEAALLAIVAGLIVYLIGM